MIRNTALLCGLLLTFAMQAGAQLNVAVQMDPNPSPYISDWRSNPNVLRFIVTNPTGSDVDVRFIGYIEGDARGKVAETIDDSRIPPVTIPPGTIILNAVDIGILDEGSVLYTGPTSEETRRSGRLPEDNYRICVQLMAYGPPYNLLTPEACSRFAVRLIMPPMLIAPANELDVKSAPGFQWSVVPLGTGEFARYEVTVIELVPGQTNYTQAIKTNIPLMQRETNISAYQILPSDPQLEKGRSYAWQVRAFDMQDRYMFANDGLSEIWTFLYDPPVPPGFKDMRSTADVKTPSKSVKADVSNINVNPNFIYTGLTYLRGTLITTFYKGRVPQPKSVTVHDPTPKESKKSDKSGTKSSKPAGQVKSTGAAQGVTQAGTGGMSVAPGGLKLGNVFYLGGKEDQALGGVHLSLYRNVRTDPVCGIHPYATAGKSYYSEQIVATATTKSDGSFEFKFFAHDSTGRIYKDAFIRAGGTGDVGRCDFTGDLYLYYSIRVTDPHLCSPSDEFAVQPGESADVGNVYSLVRSYNVTVQVSDQKNPDLKLNGMNVLVIRRNRPFDVPENEGTLYPHEPADFPHNSEIIGRGETDAYGLCTFRHMVKNVGGPDYYDLWITNPEESVYYYARCWKTFRFGFLLTEKDELGNSLVWDQAINNESYDPENMRATVDARMYPKLPRIKGRVYRADNTLQPLANTWVTLYRKSTTITALSIQLTNDSGGFVFDKLLPTEGNDFYFLKFEKYGYKKRYEPPDLSVDQIKLKRGEQRSFQKVLLDPKLRVRGKIIDELGRPVAATVRVGTGENVHTVKKFKIVPKVATPPKLSLTTMQSNPVVQKSAVGSLMKVAPKVAKIGLVTTTFSFDEEFSTPAPIGNQKIYIMPDNVELYHKDTLSVFLPDGTEDLGEFVVYMKAHRLAVRAVAEPPPPPPPAGTTAPRRKSSRKSSQVQVQQTPLSGPAAKPGSIVTQSQVSGAPLQMGINQFLIPLLANSLVIHGCTITVNGQEPDSIDAFGVHYFVWFSAGTEAEVHVEGPSNRDYVPKTVITDVPDDTPAWHEMNVPLEFGGRLSGTVMVGEVPIAGARVALYDNPADPEPQQTYTDAGGKYTLRGLRAGVHNFLAAKSKSQFIGDTAAIAIMKGQESILDFELTAYNDMDITTLLGFPIEVTTLDSTGGGVTISGTFVELPSNTQFAPEDSTSGLPFTDIVIAPSAQNNANGIPYAEPSTLPLVTPVNSWDISAFDGVYRARQHDAVSGLRVRHTGERGEIIGAVKVLSSSFTFPSGSFKLGDADIALSLAPGTPEGMIIPAITSDAGPASTLPQGFHPLAEDGTALRYTLYDFDTRCDSMRSYFRDDTLSLATILHTNIENIATPDLAIDIGALRVHHNKVESIASSDEMQIVLEGDWKITSRSWTLNHNGLSLDSGSIRAAFLGVPFKGMKIFPDQIAFGSFNLDKLIMSDAAEIFVTGKTQFGFDPGTKHWALSVAPQALEDDECGWMMPVPPMAPTDRIRFNNFFLQSSGSKGFTMKPGATVTLSKVGQYAINQFIPKNDFIQIAGSLELGIPNLPMINQIGSILKEDGESKFLLDPINETIAVNGVRIKFKTAKGQQDWQVGGLHSGVLVYEEGAFNLNSMLHHTPSKTELIVNEGEVVDVGTEVQMTDVVGEMHVADNAWELFWFEGDLQNDDQGGRLKFTVQGDIVASGQEIGVDKIETPFGDIALIYNFQEQQLEGTLHVEQDLDGTKIVGDATLLVSGAGKGWYFFCGASFSLPQPKVDGTAAFAVGNFKLTQKQLDQFADYSYERKGLPPQFHNFNGFFFEGTVMIPPPVFCPNFDFDFGIVSAYMICQVGANARFGMNFGPVDTYFISIRGIGKLEAGVGMSVVIACAGVSAGILIEPNVEGMYQSDGTWYVLGDFPITLYGTAYAGWGICDSKCEGALCDKESVSASITLGMKGYVGSDDKYFKFYFK